MREAGPKSFNVPNLCPYLLLLLFCLQSFLSAFFTNGGQFIGGESFGSRLTALAA